jgi:hypothetical protein
MERTLVEHHRQVHPFSFNWFYQKYFNRRWRSVYMQAQLFAVPSKNQPTDQSTSSLSQGNKLDCVDGMLDTSTIRDLSQDLLNKWDKHCPASNFEPFKAFQGVYINHSANQQIQKSQFQ